MEITVPHFIVPRERHLSDFIECGAAVGIHVSFAGFVLQEAVEILGGSQGLGKAMDW